MTGPVSEELMLVRERREALLREAREVAAYRARVLRDEWARLREALPQAVTVEYHYSGGHADLVTRTP